MIPDIRRLGARPRLGASTLAVLAALAIAAPPVHAQDPSPPAGDGRFAAVARYRVDDHGSNVQPGTAPRTAPAVAWSATVPDSVAVTPLLSEGLLLIADAAGGLTAFDPATGAQAWSVDLGWGVTGAIVADGILVASLTDPEGSVTGVEVATGTPRWTTKGLGNTRAGSLSHLGDQVVLGSDDGTLYQLDPRTGAEVKTWAAPGPVGSLAIVDDTAYLGLDDGRTVAIDLETGEQPWLDVPLLSEAPSSIAVGDELYYIAARQPPGDPSSELLAIDRGTGEVAWRFRAPSGRQVGPGALHDGTLFSGSEADGLFALDAATGETRWHAEDAPGTAGMASYVDGLVLVASFDQTLSAWDATTGDPVWSVPLESPASTSPIASGGSIFLGDERGHVWALGTPTEPASTPVPSDAAASPATGSAPLTVVAAWDSTTITGMDQPCAGDMAASGDLVLPSCLTGEILVIGPDGTVKQRFGSLGTKEGQFRFQRDPEDPFSAIGGAAVAPDGTIYVADTVNRRVQRFTADGEFLDAFGSYGDANGQFLEPFDITVGPDGTVYVVDDLRDDIQRFTPDGTHIQTIGSHGKGPGQLWYTSNIETAPDGTLLNADWDNERIQAWTADGEFLWTVGKRGTGPGEFQKPADVVMLEDGRIVASDFDGNRIQVFAPDRTPIGDLPLTDSETYGPVYGLVDAGDGRIYAIRPFGDQILVLEIAPAS